MQQKEAATSSSSASGSGFHWETVISLNNGMPPNWGMKHVVGLLVAGGKLTVVVKGDALL